MARVKEEIKNNEDELDLDSTKEESKVIEKTSVNTGIGRYWTKEVEKPEYATPLVEVKRMLAAKYHDFTKEGGPRICYKSKIYGGDDNTFCRFCDEDTQFKDKKGKPKKNACKNGLIFPAYVFDRVGRTYELEIDGQKKEFDENPEKIVILNRNNGDTNITAIRDCNEDGSLTECVFELRRYKKEDKKSMSFGLTDRMRANKKFTHLGGCEIPEAIKEKWDNMTGAEVRGFCLNVLMPEWENETVKERTVKPKPIKGEGETKELSEDLDG